MAVRYTETAFRLITAIIANASTPSLPLLFQRALHACRLLLLKESLLLLWRLCL